MNEQYNLMESIEELHDFFDKRGVEQNKLKKSALYVENYTEVLYSAYEVNITKEQIEIVSVNLYKTLLHQCKTMSMQIEKPAEDIIKEVLKDFESGEEEAIGNLIAIIGKAGTIEDTRHPKITEIAQKIAKQQQSNF